MSRAWQQSWEKALAYWQQSWKQWTPVAMVLTLWIWVIFLVARHLTPFILMQFQPINSKSLVQSYHHNLTQLVAQLPVLALVLVMCSVIGGFLTVQLLRTRRSRQTGVYRQVVSSALMTGLALLGAAVVRIPMVGPYLNPWSLALRTAVMLGIFIMLLPWCFWTGPLNTTGGRSFWEVLRQNRRDTLYLAWSWLVALVLAELLSAAIAWTTTLNILGTLVLAFLLVTSGLLLQSVAYFYAKDAATLLPAIQKTS